MNFLVQRRQRGETEWKDIDVVSWECTPRTLDMTVPSARITLSNRNGRYSTKIRTRDEFRIEVDKDEIFHGIMLNDAKEVTAEYLQVTAHHKDYYKLIDKLCSDAYKQFGYSAWKWGSATQVGRTEIGGLRPDQVFKAALGTKFYVQTFFEAPSVVTQFSDVALEENKLMLARDVASVDEEFLTDGFVVFQDMTNVLIGYDEMPDIRDVVIKLAGLQNPDTSITLEVSRNSGVNTITKVPVYVDGIWTVDIDEAEWAATAVRNQLRVKINLFANPSQTSSPLIQSMLIEGTIESPAGNGDTSLTEGIIEAYVDPDAFEDEMGGDFSRQNRLQVAQAAIKGAVSGGGEQYPSWFGYIEDGAAHFRNPSNFGTDYSDTIIFSRDQGTCEDVTIETTGTGIINNLMYIGQGIPPYGEIVLTAVDHTGLKNDDSIALYGEIQGTVQEKGIPSITYADKRARILAKHLAFPQVSYTITNPDPDMARRLSLGDRVRLIETKYGVNTVLIVLEKNYAYTSDGLVLELVVSNNKVTTRSFAVQSTRSHEANNLISQGSMSPPAISFQDNFDEEHPVELAFWLPLHAKVRSVRGYFKSSKFRANSLAGEAESEHTHTLAGIAVGAGGANIIRPTFNDKTGTGDNTNYGGQGLSGTASISGSVAEPSDVSMSNIDPYGTSSVGVGALAFTTRDLLCTATQLTNLEGIFLQEYFLDAPDPVWMTGEIVLLGSATSGGALSEILVLAAGTAAAGEAAGGPDAGHACAYSGYLPGNFLRSFFGSTSWIRGVRFRIQNLINAANTISYGGGMWAFTSKHIHGGATLNPGGTTGSAFKTPGLSLDASTFASLLSETRVGYSQASGGVGTLLYNTGGVNYYQNHEHILSGSATGPGSAHAHAPVYKIHENPQYPYGVSLYIKDYPNLGDNADENNLTVPFGPFGKRGSEATSFEVASIDLSAGLKDPAGDFRTGQLIKMWLKSTGTVANPDGLGRLTAHLFIELVEGTDV